MSQKQIKAHAAAMEDHQSQPTISKCNTTVPANLYVSFRYIAGHVKSSRETGQRAQASPARSRSQPKTRGGLHRMPPDDAPRQ